MSDKRDRLRRLPSVDRLLSLHSARELTALFGQDLAVDAIRAALSEARSRLLDSQITDHSENALLERAAHLLHQKLQPSLRPVINATGVIVHTNLGRALLSDGARRAIDRVSGAYNTLEFDLERGKRGSRLGHGGDLLRELTGAEDALVVNNNAAALILILSALAQGSEVLISRGQLVEIGGGFRIPDIMRESGAHLVEVGTTNRTRIADFKAGASQRAAMILRVHASNFKQLGFVEQPEPAELTAFARELSLLAVDDLGSGTLIDTRQFGMAYEPTVQDSVKAGFDLICFSGDKLLGGPQAGIIIGKSALIARLRRHPLARALRVDKLTYAALLATLEHYARGEALRQVPVWRMIAASADEIARRANLWARQVGGRTQPGASTVGGGSLPGATLPTTALAIASSSPDRLMARLRGWDPPVIARIASGEVLLDPRTVLPEQDDDLLRGLRAALAE